MASINRDSLAHHMRVVALYYTNNAAVAVEAAEPRIAEQFNRQAVECIALADALDDGQPVTITGE